MAEYNPTGTPDFDSPNEEDANGEYAYDQQEDAGDAGDEGDDDDNGEEDDDYDPSSFNFGNSAEQVNAEQPDDLSLDGAQTSAQPTPPEASHSEQVPKPKTVGGFIVEDDDEDAEDENTTPAPSQLNGSEGAQSGLGAVAVSEARDVSLASAPTTDTAALLESSSTSLNGSAAVSVSDVTLPIPPLPIQSVQADQGKIVTSTAPTPQPLTNGTPATPQTSVAIGQIPTMSSAVRLPHDKVGRLEDRIKDDPKGDIDAWMSLLAHYREKDQLDNVRKTYDRLLEIFPSGASIWVQYIQLELEYMVRHNIDTLFYKSLERVANVELWMMYLNYLRRVLPLTSDTSGENRKTITQAFEAVLNAIGIDPDAGKVWREYVEFMRSGPGIIGGTGWQDAQKGDLLRQAFQRAVKLPHTETVRLWREYDTFEMSQHKQTGRKNINEQSPHYVTAKAAATQVSRLLEGLDRSGLPKLPPVHGFEGEEQYGTQVEKWREWIDWEKSDPLVFREDDMASYRKRVVYVYKQATMQLRFYPHIWFEAAQWCFEQGTEDTATEGEQFLDRGIEANPESVLLALKKADRIESNLEAGNTDDIAIRNGEKLDVPYENVHRALYGLREKMVEREKRDLRQIQEHFASLSPEEEQELQPQDDEDDDDNSPTEKPKNLAEQMQAQIQTTTSISRGRMETLKRTISCIWVAKMRAFRRIQGQGMPNKPKKGFRGVFAEARPRGQLSSDVYIASALMEWHCYKDPSALKIFERGLKLFPTDEVFAQEYIEHLISSNDLTNARVVFETTVTKILGASATPELQRKQKCRPLLAFMHGFESKYGDLAQIQKIEKRMAEMFPDEVDFTRFSRRYVMPPNFDGIDVQLIISPTQARPKAFDPAQQQLLPSIEQPRSPPESNNIRLGPNGPYVASPKRPLEDSDNDTPQRKFMRGESPLKGAAGRRIQHNTNASASGLVGMGGGGSGFAVKTFVPPSTVQLPVGPAPLAPGIMQMLQVIPHARDYAPAVVFEPARTVEFLRGLNIDASRVRLDRR